MLVVADASPLIVLCNIAALDILPALFGKVFVPPQVVAELTAPPHFDSVRSLMEKRPAWFLEQAPAQIEPIAKLDPGERAAISLALEIRADLLLIDEVAGRQEAIRRGLRITGTIGILELAADRDLVVLADAFERMKRTDFWVSHDFLDERLQLHLARRNKP